MTEAFTAILHHSNHSNNSDEEMKTPHLRGLADRCHHVTALHRREQMSQKKLDPSFVVARRNPVDDIVSISLFSLTVFLLSGCNTQPYSRLIDDPHGPAAGYEIGRVAPPSSPVVPPETREERNTRALLTGASAMAASKAIPRPSNMNLVNAALMEWLGKDSAEAIRESIRESDMGDWIERNAPEIAPHLRAQMATILRVWSTGAGTKNLTELQARAFVQTHLREHNPELVTNGKIFDFMYGVYRRLNP